MRKMKKVNVQAKGKGGWGTDKGRLERRNEMRKRCLKLWKGEKQIRVRVTGINVESGQEWKKE